MSENTCYLLCRVFASLFRSFSRGVYFVLGPASGGLLFPSEVFAL